MPPTATTPSFIIASIFIILNVIISMRLHLKTYNMTQPMQCNIMVYVLGTLGTALSLQFYHNSRLDIGHKLLVTTTQDESSIKATCFTLPQQMFSEDSWNKNFISLEPGPWKDTQLTDGHKEKRLNCQSINN